MSYESQQDVLMMRFADYFGGAFEHVGGAQFPWLKTFKESSVEKLVDVSLFVFYLFNFSLFPSQKQGYLFIMVLFVSFLFCSVFVFFCFFRLYMGFSHAIIAL